MNSTYEKNRTEPTPLQLKKTMRRKRPFKRCPTAGFEKLTRKGNQFNASSLVEMKYHSIRAITALLSLGWPPKL